MAIETLTAVNERELTAFHEAGHAVASYELRKSFSYVTVIPGEDFQGRMLGGGLPKGFQPDLDVSLRDRIWIENRVKIFLAGPIAEQIRANADEFSPGSNGDVHWAVYLLDFLVGSPEELEAYLHLLQIQTKKMIQRRLCWEPVVGVAEALLKDGTLGYRKTRQVIKQVRTDKLGVKKLPPLKKLSPLDRSRLKALAADDVTTEE